MRRLATLFFLPALAVIGAGIVVGAGLVDFSASTSPSPLEERASRRRLISHGSLDGGVFGRLRRQRLGGLAGSFECLLWRYRPDRAAPTINNGLELTR